MASRFGALTRSAVQSTFRRSSSAARTPFSGRSGNPFGNDSRRAAFRRRFSYISRLPAEMGCAESLIPLHNAVAAARLTSHLSINSRSCSALSQGTLCRTSPDR